MRMLKPEYQKLNDNFNNDGGCCSCHINPPCAHCTHEGNPANLAEDELAWLYVDSYVGVKAIGATPQTDGRNNPGYAVIYPDGYISWSPKAEFEKAYVQVADDIEAKALQATTLRSIYAASTYDDIPF